jgi:hypothetical protein
MKCPEDSNMTDEGKKCRVRSRNMMTCTRKKGHRGKHHAHGMAGNCYEVWRKMTDNDRPHVNVLEINDTESCIWKVKFKGISIESDISFFSIFVESDLPATFVFGTKECRLPFIKKIKCKLRYDWLRFKRRFI